MNKNQRIAMAEKDLTVRKLSKILKRTEQHVSNVLSANKGYKCLSLRKRIAHILDKPERYLWPNDPSKLSLDH